MKSKKEKDEYLNSINLQILDSILEDDDELFFQQVLQNNEDKNYNQHFILTKYKLPSILSNKPTYSSLCAAFGAEKCFDSLLTLFPDGINSSSINEPDEQGREPIHFACFSGNLHILRLYYQADYDFNKKDFQDRSPCHYAAMSISIDSMKYLFSKGIKILTQRDSQFLTPMQIACLYGNIEIVKFLYEKVANGNMKFQSIKKTCINKKCENETPLHLACQSGCTEIVNYILSKKQLATKMVNAMDRKKRTPIHCAIQSGSLECVKSLIKFGNVNITAKGRRHIALIDASASGYIDIVMFILSQKNIDVNAKNSKNITALEAAILNNRYDIVKILIDNGAACNYNEYKIGDLFQQACGVKNIDIIKYLDKNFNIPYDKNGSYFMKQAVCIEWEELVCFLLDKKCTFNYIYNYIPFNGKWTPFMSFLKEKGADFLSIPDDSFTDPLIIKAIKSGNLKTVKRMIEEGAELTKDLISKHECILRACLKVKLDLINFLLSYQPEVIDTIRCIIALFDRYIETKNKTKQNISKMNDCIQIARILANQNKIDLNNHILISKIIYGCSIEFLEFLVDYSVDFNVCPLNYSIMITPEFIPIFIFLENHGCRFTNTTTKYFNYHWYNFDNSNQNDKFNYPPIFLNVSKSNSFNYDVNTLLFLIKYAKNDDLINLNYYDGNIIDILVLYKCYDDILKVYLKLNRTIYPKMQSRDDFIREINNSSNNELISFINNHQ